ncbi:deacetoxyvindoline 4-hydroxylase-like [Trifolium pratense]|uniref:deacetoxyvindoline 4-hydroxylase-like n=1 Tax=Trifolium pratense TaxID=57577 RepID=UPI001E6952CC|nr:deacetoxyvindoline 4-hydroxylase-like [Trifolium pratense]
MMEENNSATDSNLSVPIIDLIHNNINRVEVINQIKDACKKVEIFPSEINLEISVDVLDEMIDGTCRFHEQDIEWP